MVSNKCVDPILPAWCTFEANVMLYMYAFTQHYELELHLVHGLQMTLQGSGNHLADREAQTSLSASVPNQAQQREASQTAQTNNKVPASLATMAGRLDLHAPQAGVSQDKVLSKPPNFPPWSLITASPPADANASERWPLPSRRPEVATAQMPLPLRRHVHHPIVVLMEIPHDPADNEALHVTVQAAMTCSTYGRYFCFPFGTCNQSEQLAPFVSTALKCP